MRWLLTPDLGGFSKMIFLVALVLALKLASAAKIPGSGVVSPPAKKFGLFAVDSPLPASLAWLRQNQAVEVHEESLEEVGLDQDQVEYDLDEGVDPDSIGHSNDNSALFSSSAGPPSAANGTSNVPFRAGCVSPAQGTKRCLIASATAGGVAIVLIILLLVLTRARAF